MVPFSLNKTKLMMLGNIYLTVIFLLGNISNGDINTICGDYKKPINYIFNIIKL